MEIDLHELEIYEKQLAEKRRTKRNSSPAASTANVEHKTDQTVDEIDAYLEQLALDLKTKDEHTDHKPSDSNNSPNTLQNSNTQPKQCSSPSIDSKIMEADNSSSTTAAQISSQTSFPLLLFAFFSILAFVNSVRCKKCIEFLQISKQKQKKRERENNNNDHN